MIYILLVMMYFAPMQNVDTTCDSLRISHNSIERKITINSNTKIENIVITKKSQRLNTSKITIDQEKAFFFINSPDPYNWRVDFEVTDQCKTWKTYLGTL